MTSKFSLLDRGILSRRVVIALIIVSVIGSFSVSAFALSSTPPLEKTTGECKQAEPTTQTVEEITVEPYITGPNSMEFEITISQSENRSLSLSSVSSHTFTSNNNLTRIDDKAVRTSPNKTIAFTMELDITDATFQSINESEARAFAMMPRFAIRGVEEEGVVCSQSQEAVTVSNTTGPVYSNGYWFMLLNYEADAYVEKELDDGTTITIIRPYDEPVQSTRASEVVDVIEFQNQFIDAPPRDVTFFMIPQSLSLPVSGFAIDNTPTTHTLAGNTVDDFESMDSVWAHEYAHSQTNFSKTSETRWLEEATAEYLAAQFTQANFEKTGGSLPPLAVTHVPEKAHGTLNDPETWERGTPYTQGELLLYHLDHRLEPHNTSVLEMVQYANQHNGDFSQDDMNQWLTTNANTSTAVWVEKRVNGTVTINQTSEPVRPLPRSTVDNHSE